MKAIIKFQKGSPYYLRGEEERVVENLTEVHYNYPTFMEEGRTAFESDVDGTGFTIKSVWIADLEITA